MELDTKTTRSFWKAQSCLCLMTCAHHPRLHQPFIIEADASLFATGAVLLQEDSDGDEHPAGYLSLFLKPAKRNYQVYDQELHTILRALRQWQNYVQGSSFRTIVRTDHANLTYYRSPQRLTQQQTRWVVELMDYDIQLQHKPGKTMIPADALSRRHDHAKGIEDISAFRKIFSSDCWILTYGTL